MEWRAGETAPKNGKPFWGWLYDEGIHLVRWVTAEENAAADNEQGDPDEYISCFVKVTDESDGDWTVKFWLPWDEISAPTGVGLDIMNANWRDGSPPLHLEDEAA